MPRVPLVLVAGLAAQQAQEVTEALAGPDTAVVHHDLARVGEGVVRRCVRHCEDDRWDTLADDLDIDALLAAVPPAARGGAVDSAHSPLLRGR